ncbi:MAG: hypothetical protein GVY13_14825 [Alphaproteobacteria bacterium]|nr:hypothetical protein [Alphaproteobacteria bacterium]
MASGNGKHPGGNGGSCEQASCDCGQGDGADGQPCACRAAVTRAYAGMLEGGAPASVALEAALRVYRYHHPHQADDVAQTTVETWVFRGPHH